MEDEKCMISLLGKAFQLDDRMPTVAVYKSII